MRSNHVTIPVTAPWPPTGHADDHDFVLFVKEDVDEIISENIERITEQLSTEPRYRLKRAEAKNRQKSKKIHLRFTMIT